MLKLPVKYTDYDGKQHEDVLYFNLSQTELIELEVSVEEGFGEMLQRIAKTTDKKQLIALFKKIVLMSYGLKSEDGKRFIKTPELTQEFEQHAAFQSLFMRLATEDNFAVTFINGLMPAEMLAEIQKAQAEREAEEKAKAALPETASAPPVPPQPPTAG